MRKVQIDRATWNCGAGGDGDNMLLNQQGMRCCLGFLGEAVGLDDENAFCELPSEVRDEANWPKGLFSRSPYVKIAKRLSGMDAHSQFDWESVLAEINDREDINAIDRESWISTGFWIVLDCEVEFVGSYPEAA